MYRVVCAVVLSSAVCAACADVASNGTVASADPTALSGGKQAELADAHCLKSTGSLASSPSAKCGMLHGNVYDRDQIDATGYVSLGDALRQLDPSLTISH